MESGDFPQTSNNAVCNSPHIPVYNVVPRRRSTILAHQQCGSLEPYLESGVERKPSSGAVELPILSQAHNAESASQFPHQKVQQGLTSPRKQSV